MRGVVLHLHAGLPKTATSATQRFLMLNRDRLAGAGLFVPRTGQRPDGPHHALARAMAGLPGAGADPTEALLAEIAGSGLPTALVTSELILPLMRARLLGRALRRLRGSGLRLVFHLVVRPQEELWNAAWPEMLRATLIHRGFRGFVAGRLRAPSRDFAVLARTLAAAGEVRLHPMTHPGGPWRAILADAGVAPDPEWLDPGRVNPTPGPVAAWALAETVRRLNAETPPRGLSARLAAGQALIAASRAFPVEPAAFAGFDAAGAARVRMRVAAANEALALARWGRSWDAVFPEAASRDWQRRVFFPASADPAGRAAAEALVEAGLAACRATLAAAPPPGLRDRALDHGLRLAMRFG